MHTATHRFWHAFEALPGSVKKIARKNFKLLKAQALHPSLHFKKVGKFWSIRVGASYRALAIRDHEDFVWVWIGSHAAYDRLITKR